MRMQGCDVVAALVGPPNSGKTSLFNALTGRAEKVANWPGVTVDVKTAVVKRDGTRICIVDLPGTYSLSGSGPEERVTRDFLLENSIDVVIAAVDATRPPQGLYLAVEVKEAALPLIVALTKIDSVDLRRLDIKGLEESLGAAVVPTSALKGIGLDKLISMLMRPPSDAKPLRINYGRLEGFIAELERLLRPCLGVRARWTAIKLLEDVEAIYELLSRRCGASGEEAVKLARELRERYRRETGRDPAEDIIAVRYQFVEQLVERHFNIGVETGLTGVDRVFLHPVLGPIASIALLTLIFLTVFTLNTGFPLNLVFDALGLHRLAEVLEAYSLVGLLGALFDRLASLVEASVGGWLGELLGGGIVGGVGLVLSFLPLVALIYAIFGALEDSGLAARMALAYEPLLERFGLSGKAIFPYIMSLGCNVPAVFATRILETRRERLAVALSIPFIPCQARLVVIMAFVAAFFADNPGAAAAVALGVYLTAFLVALLTAKLVTSISGRGEEHLGALELPPLKRPSLQVVWWQVRDAIEHFLVRAGTLILALSLATWLASRYTPWLAPATTPEESIAAALGRLLAPLASIVFGVGYWQAWRLAFGFLEGLVAKEMFLDAPAMVAPRGVEIKTPADAVAYLHLTIPQAVSVLVAITLYMPCVATLAAIYSELRSGKLVAASLSYSILVATVAALAVRLILTPLSP